MAITRIVRDFKFPSSLGMGPNKLFSATYRDCKLLRFPSDEGMEPESWFWYKERTFKDVKAPNDEGIELDRLFEYKYRNSSETMLPISGGISPENWFCEKSRYISLERSRICGGIGPKKLFTLRSKCVRFCSKKNEISWSVPLNPEDVRFNFWMLSSALQTTPNHEVHGIDALEFIGRGIHEESKELFGTWRVSFHLRRASPSSTEAEANFGTGESTVMNSRVREKNKKYEEDIICFALLCFEKWWFEYSTLYLSYPFVLGYFISSYSKKKIMTISYFSTMSVFYVEVKCHTFL